MDDLKIVSIARKIFQKNNFENCIVLELSNNKIIVIKQKDNESIANTLLVAVIEEYVNVKYKIFDEVNDDIFYIFDKDEDLKVILNDLKGCNAHASFILSVEDERKIKSFGM